MGAHGTKIGRNADSNLRSGLGKYLVSAVRINLGDVVCWNVHIIRGDLSPGEERGEDSDRGRTSLLTAVIAQLAPVLLPAVFLIEIRAMVTQLFTVQNHDRSCGCGCNHN